MKTNKEIKRRIKFHATGWGVLFTQSLLTNPTSCTPREQLKTYNVQPLPHNASTISPYEVPQPSYDGSTTIHTSKCGEVIMEKDKKIGRIRVKTQDGHTMSVNEYTRKCGW
jgi:hypothetical protein